MGVGKMRTKKDLKPFLRVDTKCGKLVFNRVVHDLLGEPPYFMFYWRKDKNALYVAPQWEETRHSFAIPAYVLKTKTRFEILCYRQYLFEDLQNRMNWKHGRVYKVYGTFDKIANMVWFQLDNMQMLEGIDI